MPTPTPTALPELVERNLDVMRSHVQVMLGPFLRTKEAVSDIVQSAVRELLENPGGFVYQGDEDFRMFLHRVIDNKIANKRRHYTTQKRSAGEVPVSAFEHLLTDGGPTPSQLAAEGEELEQLRSAIDELDEEDRRLFSMHKILELSMAEIARELGKPETTVRSRMARILAGMAFRLDGGGGA